MRQGTTQLLLERPKIRCIHTDSCRCKTCKYTYSSQGRTVSHTQKEVTLCVDCTEYVFKDELEEFIIKGVTKLLCNDCKDEYSTCQLCENIFPNDDLSSVQGKYGEESICEACRDTKAWECSDCSEYYYNDAQQYNLANDDYICDTCYMDGYFTCNSCNYIFHSNDGYNCDTCDNEYCEECYNEDHQHEEDEELNERRYDTEPKKGEKAGEYITIDRFIGVEIEAENGSRNSLEIPSACGITADGSLDSNTGVEIQTPPRSLDLAEDIIKQTCKGLNDAGFSATSSCGLHVHIDGRDMRSDPKKLAQVLRTFYAVEDVLFSMLPRSRWDSTYCQRLSREYAFNDFKDKITIDDFESQWYKTVSKNEKINHKSNKWSNTRYCGLNLHSELYQGTLEVRYHSGTTNARKILQWVNILLRLVEYAVNKYDDKTIIKLYSMPLSSEKLALFFKTFTIPSHTQDYIHLRIKECNPVYQEQFRTPDFHKKLKLPSYREYITRKGIAVWEGNRGVKPKHKHYLSEKVLKSGNESQLITEVVGKIKACEECNPKPKPATINVREYGEGRNTSTTF